MNERFTPSPEELRLLTEHLHYEIQMTFDLAVSMRAAARCFPLLVQNAMVETFPVHVRQLVEFFWGVRSPGGKNERDAFAADYFDPGVWEELRPARSRELDEVWVKVGWGIVHLTYGRANVTPQQKQWRPLEIARALAPVVLCFVENVDPEKLDREWFGATRACVARFVSVARDS